MIPEVKGSCLRMTNFNFPSSYSNDTCMFVLARRSATVLGCEAKLMLGIFQKVTEFIKNRKPIGGQMKLSQMMFVIMIMCSVILTACNKKNDDQGPAPVVCGPNQHQVPGGGCVDNPVEPTPTPVIEDECPEALPGVYVCYDWGKCQGLFATFEEAAAIGLVMNETGCHKVDGVATQDGFGPCSQCHSIKPDGTVPYTIPFEEVLRQRAIMWMNQ